MQIDVAVAFFTQVISGKFLLDINAGHIFVKSALLSGPYKVSFSVLPLRKT